MIISVQIPLVHQFFVRMDQVGIGEKEQNVMENENIIIL